MRARRVMKEGEILHKYRIRGSRDGLNRIMAVAIQTHYRQLFADEDIESTTLESKQNN